MHTSLNITCSALIDQCYEVTSNPGFTDLRSFAETFRSVDLEDCRKFISFNQDSYKRNIITTNQYFELVLICWEPNQSTDIHDHPEKGCLIQVLDGELTEERFYQDEVTINNLSAGPVYYMCNAYGMHRMANGGAEPAISLHLYAPGN